MSEDGFYRISVVLNDKSQHNDWIEFTKQKGFGNLSQMIRSVVENARVENSDLFKKELQPIKDSIQGLHNIVKFNHEQSELILMKLTTEDKRSDVTKAAKEVLSVLKTVRTPAEICGKLNYHENVVRNALTLIHDIGIFEIKMINPEKKDKEI